MLVVRHRPSGFALVPNVARTSLRIVREGFRCAAASVLQGRGQLVSLPERDQKALTRLSGGHPLLLTLIASFANVGTWPTILNNLNNPGSELSRLIFEFVTSALKGLPDGPERLVTAFANLFPNGASQAALRAVFGTDTEPLLRVLTDAHLLDPTRLDGRYALQPTLKLYFEVHHRHTALASDLTSRYVAYYVEYCDRVRTHSLALDGELDNILLATDRALALQLLTAIIDFGFLLASFFVSRGYWFDGRRILSWASDAARRTGDLEAASLFDHELGVICIHQGQYQQATEHLERAFASAEQLGDKRASAASLFEMANACLAQDRLSNASVHNATCTALASALDDRHLQFCASARRY